MHRYTDVFKDVPPLDQRVQQVLCAVPQEILRDFEADPRFHFALDNHDPRQGRSVWLAAPGTPGNGSRCVVLKAKLAEAPEPFALYVIAHELAHAYLRNGGYGDVTDAEAAADLLAAHWGYMRPNDRQPVNIQRSTKPSRDKS